MAWKGWILVAIMGSGACSPTSSDQSLTEPVAPLQDLEALEKIHGPRTYYVLKVINPNPDQGPKLLSKKSHWSPTVLPQKTQILVHWTLEDGYGQSFPGFYGWDLDGDGRFEMLEVLDPKGKVKNQVFDFDGDGKVDHVSGVLKSGPGGTHGD